MNYKAYEKLIRISAYAIGISFIALSTGISICIATCSPTDGLPDYLNNIGVKTIFFSGGSLIACIFFAICVFQSAKIESQSQPDEEENSSLYKSHLELKYQIKVLKNKLDEYESKGKKDPRSLPKHWEQSGIEERKGMLAYLMNIYNNGGDYNEQHIIEFGKMIDRRYYAFKEKAISDLEAKCQDLQKQLDECGRKLKSQGNLDNYTLARNFINRAGERDVFAILERKIGNILWLEWRSDDCMRLNGMAIYVPKVNADMASYIEANSVRLDLKSIIIVCENTATQTPEDEFAKSMNEVEAILLGKEKGKEQNNTEPTDPKLLINKNLETMKDLRKCEFELNGEFVDGFFHKWENEAAIVEDRKGRCHLVEMTRVRFTDFLRDTVDKVLGR
jgi:hypothetical protein